MAKSIEELAESLVQKMKEVQSLNRLEALAIKNRLVNGNNHTVAQIMLKYGENDYRNILPLFVHYLAHEVHDYKTLLELAHDEDTVDLMYQSIKGIKANSRQFKRLRRYLVTERRNLTKNHAHYKLKQETT